MPKENVELGEAIHVWIEHKGSLDLDTPEEEIWRFYYEYTRSVHLK